MRILSFLSVLFFYLLTTRSIFALYDPRLVPNNKVGIHILFTDELSKAAKIVNRNQETSWGYVTIPIQSSDRNRQKWQQFFDDCSQEKIIPIIRIATSPQGSNWDRPGSYDLIDFANFLNDLKWPTQNRYLVIFNEVNRPDEYGGQVSPENYADILSKAIDIFKQRSADFFILPAGLDNAAISRRGAIRWDQYLTRMYRRQPNIFNRLDGWTSHAYPNPDFSSRPDLSGSNKIDSFRYDLKLISRFTDKKLPVFITETGWSGKYLSESQLSYYYQYAFNHVWSDPEVVAVTPFLLNAQDGPFVQFSFYNSDLQEKAFSQTLSQFSTRGEPLLSQDLAFQIPVTTTSASLNSQVMGLTSDSESDPVELIKKLYNQIKIIIGILN